MKIRDLSVGIRLGVGFSLVLLLVIIMAIVGVWRLNDILHETDEVTDDYLIRERVATEWLSIIDTNGALGLVVMTATDPEIKQFATQKMKKNSERTSVVKKKLEEMITSERGKELMRNVSAQRQAYTTTRSEIIENSGQEEGAATNQLIRTRLLPAMEAYSDSVKAIVANQQTLIDNAGETIQAKGYSAEQTLVLLGALAVLLGSLLAWLITRSITGPLLTAVHVAREVAGGNLSMQVTADSRDQLGQLMQALNEMTVSLRNTVRKVRLGADNIALAAAEINSGNHDLSARTEEQAASVEQTAATLEELSSTINNTAGHTTQAHQYVTEAAAIVKQNGSVMREVTTRMQEIYASSSKMSDIIQVIDGIAFQTNILALNAAVEAARAGESGRGFAVVAGEVRILAQRSASAASEIKALIDGSVSQIASGRTLVEKADGGMGEIVSNVQNLEQIINEIAQASREQSDGIVQINGAMGQIDTATQQNASLVEESAAAAASMQDQSRDLQEMVSVFRLNENHNSGEGAQSVTAPRQLPVGNSRQPLLVKPREKVVAESDNWETF